MSLTGVQEIFSNPDNQYLLGSDNIFNFQYGKTRAGNLQLNIRDSSYTNVRLKYITLSQSGDRKQVLDQGQKISFDLKSQPYGAIESIKFNLEFLNNKATAYPIDNIFELIEYVEILNDNKPIERIDSETLHLYNQMKIDQNSSTLQLQNKGLSQTQIAANSSLQCIIDIPCFLSKQGILFSSLGKVDIDIKFMPDRINADVQNVLLEKSELLVYYYEVLKSQQNSILSQPYIDNRYLQIDHVAYSYSNVQANQAFKIKLTQEAVTPFLLFYVQTKSDSDSLTNKFNNFLDVISYDLLGRNNQSVMNGVLINKCINSEQIIKHFPDLYMFQNSSSKQYGKIQLLNFCLNPQFALKNNYVGGQQLDKDDYELKMTLGAAQSSIVVHMFVFKYQMSRIEKKEVYFFDK